MIFFLSEHIIQYAIAKWTQKRVRSTMSDIHEDNITGINDMEITIKTKHPWKLEMYRKINELSDTVKTRNQIQPSRAKYLLISYGVNY